MAETEAQAVKIWWLVNSKESIPPTKDEIEQAELWLVEANKVMEIQHNEILKLRRSNVSYP